ncbi:MAG: hypothetical protein K0S70_470 [Microbacterium sp.]|jgi:hypothetical protein|nr:hypothetical protein [Microbacterium sp.]
MSTPSFYSDRINGPVARTHEDLPEATADGLKALVQRRIDADFLAEEFPSYCSDGNGIEGTNNFSIGPDLTALVPGATWPLWQEWTEDTTLFDIVEYVGQRVSKPSNGHYHSFMRHYELDFDKKAGRAQFRQEVNAILSRGGTVYEMSGAMEIHRVGSPEVQAALRTLRPATGDATLDGLLETAREKYHSRSADERAVAIEKLWDGFERLKSIDDPANKKNSATLLLANIPDAAVRGVIEEEMFALTKLGNNFHIRHWESDKHPVPADAQDYLATRMVNLIVYLLDQSGRLAPA